MSASAKRQPATLEADLYGGKVKSFDDSEAKKVAGVVKIFKIDGGEIPSEFMPLGGVAVVAKNTWSAMKARDALQSNNNLAPRIASADWGTAGSPRGDFNYYTGMP